MGFSFIFTNSEMFWTYLFCLLSIVSYSASWVFSCLVVELGMFTTLFLYIRVRGSVAGWLKEWLLVWKLCKRVLAQAMWAWSSYFIFVRQFVCFAFPMRHCNINSISKLSCLLNSDSKSRDEPFASDSSMFIMCSLKTLFRGQLPSASVIGEQKIAKEHCTPENS